MVHRELELNPENRPYLYFAARVGSGKFICVGK